MKYKNINLIGIYNLKKLIESGPLKQLNNYNAYHYIFAKYFGTL
jgi:hypothetical protein